MKDHKIVNGEKVFLTDTEQTEKDEHEAIWVPEEERKDPFRETMIEMVSELSGETKSEIETRIENKTKEIG